jgi:hypothetical protein
MSRPRDIIIIISYPCALWLLTRHANNFKIMPHLLGLLTNELQLDTNNVGVYIYVQRLYTL